jgi:hypothetical protein
MNENNETENFEVNNYFKVDGQIIVNGPRFDSNHNIVSYSVVGPSNIYDFTKKNTISFARKMSMNFNNDINKYREMTKSLSKQNSILELPIKNKPQPSLNKITSEKIDKFELEKIYENLKRNMTNEKMVKDLPINLKDSLNFQENFFKKIDTINSKVRSLSKNISLKINKKEEELLMNKSSLHRVKTEIHYLIDQKRQGESCNNFNRWMNTLRRDKNSINKERKMEMYNAGTDLKPIWINQISSPSKSTDIIRPSLIDKVLPSVDKYSKSKYVEKISKKYEIRIEKLLNTNTFKIEGIDLLEQELKDTMKLKGKMIIYHPYDFNDNTEIIKKDYEIKIPKKVIGSRRTIDSLSTLNEQHF